MKGSRTRNCGDEQVRRMRDVRAGLLGKGDGTRNVACCERPQGVGRAAPKGVLWIELGPPPEICVGALALFGDRTHKEVIKVK